MKRKSLIAMAVAGMMLAGQMTAWAAPSPSTSVTVTRPSGSGNRGSNGASGNGANLHRYNTSASAGGSATTAGTVTINEANVPLASGPLAAALGFHTTTLATSTGVNGSIVSVVANAQTTITDKGEVVNNGLALSFANGAAATAGLPDHVVDSINKINAGQSLSATLNSPELAGYNALTGTHALIAKDPDSSEVKTGTAQVQLYVPNLVEGLNNVSVLFYDNVSGQWKVLPATVDPATKLVTVNVTGSGTLTVIYK